MNQVATTQAKPLTEQQIRGQKINDLKSFLSSDSMVKQIKAALPPHINAERFIRVIMTALSQNPQLVDADRNSLMMACMKCAQDGLMPDGKEAALVTFKNKTKGIVEVQYMPMFGGILKKMRNSGELDSIFAEVIYENDAFEEWTDESGQHFKFSANRFADRGTPKGAFSVGKTKDGGTYIEIMSKSQIEAVRNVSRSAHSDYSPWNGEFWEEMWKKSVIRRLSKRMPTSTDVEQTLENDNADYSFKSPSRPELSSGAASVSAQIAAPVRDDGPANNDKHEPEHRQDSAAASDKPVTQVNPAPAPKRASRAEKAMGLSQPATKPQPEKEVSQVDKVKQEQMAAAQKRSVPNLAPTRKPEPAPQPEPAPMEAEFEQASEEQPETEGFFEDETDNTEYEDSPI